MPTGVIEEPFYTEQINALRVDWKRLDDAFSTLERAILLVPDIFPMVPGTKLRRVQIVGFDGIPPLSIFFGIKGANVYLVAAELIEIEE
jgi:hypothetical protein